MYLKRLSELREYHFKKEIQQRQIAKVLDISQPAYSQFELGDKTFNFKHIYSLANFYHVNVNYILELEGKKEINSDAQLDIVAFGKNLAYFRMEILKISQAKLAKSIGVSQDTIAVCERGSRIIPTRSIINLGKIYNLSIDWLASRSDNMYIKHKVLVKS